MKYAMDVRLVLFFLAAFGGLAGIVISVRIARDRGKSPAGIASDAFMGCLAGMCGGVINWVWGIMFTVWTVIFAIPVGIKAVMAGTWPGAKAFFAFFSDGALNAQPKALSMAIGEKVVDGATIADASVFGTAVVETSFYVFWIGGAIAAIGFLFLFYKTIYEGFSPVFEKKTMWIFIGILSVVGLLALVLPAVGLTVMGIMLVGSIAVGPLLCVHDTVLCGNGESADSACAASAEFAS